MSNEILRFAQDKILNVDYPMVLDPLKLAIRYKLEYRL